MSVLWLKLSRKAVSAEAARKAKQEKAALEKEKKQNQKLAIRIVTIVAKELEIGEAFREDDVYPMLPKVMRKDLEARTRELQTIHDSADIVKDDGKGLTPTMEHVQETLKAAREVTTHIGNMVEVIRQAKCLQ